MVRRPPRGVGTHSDRAVASEHSDMELPFPRNMCLTGHRMALLGNLHTFFLSMCIRLLTLPTSPHHGNRPTSSFKKKRLVTNRMPASPLRLSVRVQSPAIDNRLPSLSNALPKPQARPDRSCSSTGEPSFSCRIRNKRYVQIPSYPTDAVTSLPAHSHPSRRSFPPQLSPRNTIHSARYTP